MEFLYDRVVALELKERMMFQLKPIRSINQNSQRCFVRRGCRAHLATGCAICMYVRCSQCTKTTPQQLFIIKHLIAVEKEILWINLLYVCVAYSANPSLSCRPKACTKNFDAIKLGLRS